MELMTRRRRASVTALVASLALLATLPALCGCLPEPAAAAEHACCTPPLGFQTAEAGCCEALDVAPDTASTASEAQPVVAPTRVVVAWAAPVATPLSDRGQALPGPAASPPLTVRRL